MKSAKHPKLIAALLLSAPLAGCGHTVIQSGVPHCERLIPQQMLKPVEGAPLPEVETWPDGHEKAQPWQEGFVTEAGQLDKANDRPQAVDHIYRTCLEMHREAERRARPRFLGIF